MVRRSLAFLVVVSVVGCGSDRSGGGAATVAPAAQVAQVGVTTVDFEVEHPGWGSAPFVALSVPANGKSAWTPDAVPLQKGADGRWRASVDVPMGASVRWKVTRGSWATVEKGPRGEEVPDRVAGERAFAHVFHWADDTIFDRQPGPRLLDLGTFKPTRLRARRVFVHLPKGYDTVTSHRWPVLYALDGQNLFDPARASFGVTWRMGEAADRHEGSGKAGFIVVGVDNTQDRMGEYTFAADKQYGGGRLEDFAAFLLDEVKPEIDHLFRTNPSREATGVIGSSLGGIAAFHIGWRHSDRVKRVGAVSPSFWWSDEGTKRVVAQTAVKPDLRLWIDMGTLEGNDHGYYLQGARDVAIGCSKLGFKWDQDLRHREFAGARHDEASWAARLPEVLAWLYP